MCVCLTGQSEKTLPRGDETLWKWIEKSFESLEFALFSDTPKLDDDHDQWIKEECVDISRTLHTIKCFFLYNSRSLARAKIRLSMWVHKTCSYLRKKACLDADWRRVCQISHSFFPNTILLLVHHHHLSVMTIILSSTFNQLAQTHTITSLKRVHPKSIQQLDGETERWECENSLNCFGMTSSHLVLAQTTNQQAVMILLVSQYIVRWREIIMAWFVLWLKFQAAAGLHCWMPGFCGNRGD